MSAARRARGFRMMSNFAFPFLGDVLLQKGHHYCISRHAVRFLSQGYQTAPAASHPTKKQMKLYGQPTPSTHSHLLQKGEVTPGISQEEFRLRRFRLMEMLAKCCLQAHVTAPNHLVVIPSGTKTYMSEKIPYVFRQNTDFLYLSGFQEPDSILVLHTIAGKALPEHKSIMFVPKKSSHAEMWDGPRTGADGAVELLGIDDAYNSDELEKYLESFAKSRNTFLLWYDTSNPALPHVRNLMDNFMQSCNIIGESPRPLIQRLRLIKSEAEIKLMRQSCETAAESMVEVMRSSHPLVDEAQLYAKMDFECRIRGAERLAYPPVVAGGKRANIIHYIANNQRVLDGEMVLMDAGCEYHGYSSDLTRTWPVNGRFTGPQQELYEVLLSVQEELIEQCAGFPTLDDLFHMMSQLIGGKLQELGIVPEGVGKIELNKVAYYYCPHHVSHYLGMDVHDTTLVPRNIKMKPGMIITIEPGLYFREDNRHIPARYRGLGLRIEDDVLITETGPEVLTSRCPKTVHEIEKLFS